MNTVLIDLIANMLSQTLEFEGVSKSGIAAEAQKIYTDCQPTREICIERRNVIDKMNKPASERLQDYYYACNKYMDYEEREIYYRLAFPYGRGVRTDEICQQIEYTLKQDLKEKVSQMMDN